MTVVLCGCFNFGNQISRDDFTAAVLGSSPEQVISKFGRPDTTDGSGHRGRSTWRYEWKTIDPISGKVDYSAKVIFVDGRAVDVLF
jgi:hypothetical protein